MYREIQLLAGKVRVRPGQTADVPEIVSYFVRNRAHLAPYLPTPRPDFYTEEHWLTRLREAETGYYADRLLNCFVFLDGAPRVVGVTNLFNFVRGAFQACHLGYSIDAEIEGSGVMSTAVRLLVNHAFEALGMHRVMANYMPDNQRSGRLLERLGFAREGFAPKYLRIAGEWRDHVLTARVYDGWVEAQASVMPLLPPGSGH